MVVVDIGFQYVLAIILVHILLCCVVLLLFELNFSHFIFNRVLQCELLARKLAGICRISCNLAPPIVPQVKKLRFTPKKSVTLIFFIAQYFFYFLTCFITSYNYNYVQLVKSIENTIYFIFYIMELLGAFRIDKIYKCCIKFFQCDIFQNVKKAHVKSI